ncbi:pilus assembly protein PilP [uncultured Salinisphaera sp.]|uniref:pilus assembly protein PilP n=1 Tax=uncultured Salinisphaera sp. TaxID=359372 RepID=UPI0032B24B98|tara:strand:- start:155 stop:694 length:540 start_codon:yes stop_codon:yes gene_type:complete
MNRRSAWYVGPVASLAVGLAIGLTGCGNDQPTDLSHFVAQINARPAPPIEPIPAPARYQPFRYEPAGRRAIFTPAAPAPGPDNGIRPDRARALEPLEQFALDELSLVGVIRMGGQSRALIRSPDGVVHRVPRGGHLGQNFGQITDIAAGQVSLVEIVPDGQGGYIKRDAVLTASPNSRS